MKWLLQTFGAPADAPLPPPDLLDELIRGMRAIDDELRDSGELVVEQGLAAPATAHVVTGTAVTAGSRADAEHALQGFWIVDVESEDRATEIAARISGLAFGAPIEVRRCMDSPDG